MGIEEHLSALQTRYIEVSEQDAIQIITVFGDAGAGKSELLTQFESWLNYIPDELTLLTGYNTPDTLYDSYGLLRYSLIQAAGIRDDDTLNAMWSKLEDLVGRVIDETRADKAHYLGYTLGLDMNLSPYIRNFKGTDEQLRNAGRHYLIQYLVATAKQNILVILWDDIQWADDESLAVLKRLVRKHPDIPLMALCSTDISLLNRYPSWTRIRPHFHHRWLQLLPTDTTDPAFG